MKRWKQNAAMAVCQLAGLCSVAHAGDLVEVFRLAEGQDPVIAAAYQALEATKTLETQMRSVLLPNVSLSANVAYHDVDTDLEDDPFAESVLGGAFDTSDFSGNNEAYDTHAYGVNLTQPVFDWEAVARFQQARSLIGLAKIQYELAYQDLILRVASAYFGVLSAEERLRTATSETQAIEQRLAQARREFEVGTAAITDTDEAQARFDLSVARELLAANNFALAKRELERIIGQKGRELKGVGALTAPAMPDPIDPEIWVQKALVSNLLVRMQEYGVEVASKEISARQGRRLPSLDASLGYNVVEEYMLGTEADITESSAKLKLSIPLFRGGLLRAQVREAAFTLSEERNNLTDSRRGAILQARQAYLQMVNEVSQIQALSQALKSSMTAYHSTRVGHEVGIRTSVDVLDALQQVYGARRDLYDARYNYLMSRLEMQAAIGALDVEDLVEVNALLSVSEVQRTKGVDIPSIKPAREPLNKP